MHSKYYNGANLLNADCPINFSIGNRSAGKSFYWKRFCIRRFIKAGEQFIYLRRYENDLDLTLPKFFEDISPMFPGYTMEVKNKTTFFISKHDVEGNVEWTKICGYAWSLNKGFKLKSIALDRVNTIFFDEFIPEDLQYLKPYNPAYEPEMLLSIYLTVARGFKQVIRPEVKFICVANAITYYNPYFTYFEIDLTDRETVIKNNIFAERVVKSEIAEEIRESKFGQIIERTKYGEYALENVAYRDSKIHIKKHPKEAKQLFALYAYNWYTCWLDLGGNIYFSDSYDRTINRKYKFIDCEEDEQIPWFKGEIVNTVRNLVYQDKVYYESIKIKSAIAGLFTPKQV